MAYGAFYFPLPAVLARLAYTTRNTLCPPNVPKRMGMLWVLASDVGIPFRSPYEIGGEHIRATAADHWILIVFMLNRLWTTNIPHSPPSYAKSTSIDSPRVLYESTASASASSKFRCYLICLVCCPMAGILRALHSRVYFLSYMNVVCTQSTNAASRFYAVLYLFYSVHVCMHNVYDEYVHKSTKDWGLEYESLYVRTPDLSLAGWMIQPSQLPSQPLSFPIAPIPFRKQHIRPCKIIISCVIDRWISACFMCRFLLIFSVR